MSETRILVTGGSGFLGNAILEYLHTRHIDWKLFSFDIKEPTNPQSYVTYLLGDCTSTSSVTSALQTSIPTAIIHAAGMVLQLPVRYTRKRQYAELIHSANVLSTQTLLSCISTFTPQIKALIFTSSVCAVTDDMSHSYPAINETWATSKRNSLLYGESKAKAEEIVLAANSTNFLTCAIRPSVLFGPGDYQLIPSIHALIAQGTVPFILGNGLNLWDVTDVRNASHAHVLAVENLLSSKSTAAGHAIFIANDAPIPFRDFCREIWKNFDVFPTWEIHIPIRLAYGIGFLLEWIAWVLGTQPSVSRGGVLDGTSVRYVDGKKAKRLLGYEPVVGLAQGIRESCEELRGRLEQERAERVKKE